jgi:hypothetical protein
VRFQEKLHEYSKEQIWEEYCGFLTLTTEEFMDIQKRLLLEQMEHHQEPHYETVPATLVRKESSQAVE